MPAPRHSLPAAAVYAYSLSDVADVFVCLHALGDGIRCPELGPSDVWGIYPVDCGDTTCDVAGGWLAGGIDILFPASRLLLEGRSGLWLPNYKHVGDTYNASIHYAASIQNPSLYQQTFCPPFADQNGGPAARTPQQEAAWDMAEDVVTKLFPAMQLLL